MILVDACVIFDHTRGKDPRLAGVFSRLQRHRSELRQHLLGFRVRDRRDVTHDVDLGAIRERELGTDSDAIPALQLESERLDERVSFAVIIVVGSHPQLINSP